jgi:hypothetical protein
LPAIATTIEGSDGISGDQNRKKIISDRLVFNVRSYRGGSILSPLLILKRLSVKWKWKRRVKITSALIAAFSGRISCNVSADFGEISKNNRLGSMKTSPRPNYWRNPSFIGIRPSKMSSPVPIGFGVAGRTAFLQPAGFFGLLSLSGYLSGCSSFPGLEFRF